MRKAFFFAFFVLLCLEARSQDTCIAVTKKTTFTGELVNGKGTKKLCLSFAGTCGASIFFDPNRVTDFIQIEYSGKKSGKIGLGSTGNPKELKVGECDTIPFNFDEEKKYKTPLSIKITANGFILCSGNYKASPSVEMNIFLSNFDITFLSNSSWPTEWNIEATPKNVCNYEKTEYILNCQDSLVLKAKCTRPEFHVLWLYNDKLIGRGDSLVLTPPIKSGVYEWQTPCNTGYYIVLPSDSVKIMQTKILCSNSSRLSLPHGIEAMWSNGEYANSIVVGPGVYWVEICGSKDTSIVEDGYHNFDLRVWVEPEADTILLSETIAQKSNSNGTSFRWLDENGEEINQPREEGLYILEGRKDYCVAYDTVFILEKHLLCRFETYTPNAFSPNGDGVEDIFYLSPPVEGGEVKELCIFDRWGEAVYKGSNLLTGEGWNGKFREKDMPAGVYVWQARIILDLKECWLEGSVTLIR